METSLCLQLPAFSFANRPLEPSPYFGGATWIAYEIMRDFILNYGGRSVAFVFATNWDPECASYIFSRIQKLRGQFANFYVVVTLPTREQNDSFIRSYFKEKSVQSVEIYIKVVTSIHGIDSHDANVLKAIGSIEEIAKASKEYILENTDLSTEKSETFARFFRDP